MAVERVQFMEHLALYCRLPLDAFCDAAQRCLGLPHFQFDSENETEWGLVRYEGVEYNISRPYERGTLQEWDPSVPAGCNFGVILIVSPECPLGQDADWRVNELTPRVGQALADLFHQPVYHHRSWLGPGENMARQNTFHPRPRS
jgi:hypothetical protein